MRENGQKQTLFFAKPRQECRGQRQLSGTDQKDNKRCFARERKKQILENPAYPKFYSQIFLFAMKK